MQVYHCTREKININVNISKKIIIKYHQALLCHSFFTIDQTFEMFGKTGNKINNESSGGTLLVRVRPLTNIEFSIVLSIENCYKREFSIKIGKYFITSFI